MNEYPIIKCKICVKFLLLEKNVNCKIYLGTNIFNFCFFINIK